VRQSTQPGQVLAWLMGKIGRKILGKDEEREEKEEREQEE
jgi:hypothetical protein